MPLVFDVRRLGLALPATGVQSALEPAGRDAERIADLFVGMTAGALVIWAVFLGLAVYAARGRRRKGHPREAAALVLGGGVVVPVVVLGALVIVGLKDLPAILAPGPPGGVEIRVVGEQWWWRVIYLRPGQPPVETANELALPVGVRTNLHLEAADVIHALWIPSLAGKVDLIPGRVTRLPLEPTRTGVFRGQCAEFCGTSHAWMALDVTVREPDGFDAWLDAQARPADATPARGLEVFLAAGCGACHAVRGTPAAGTVGPDLTHVGGRLSLGAGRLPNDAAAFERWVGHAPQVKPEVKMPGFHLLPPGDLRALAAWLDGLR